MVSYRIKERSPDDLEIIYEELVHIRALAHLSTTVKRELASIIAFESHPRADTVRKLHFHMEFLLQNWLSELWLIHVINIQQ